MSGDLLILQEGVVTNAAEGRGLDSLSAGPGLDFHRDSKLSVRECSMVRIVAGFPGTILTIKPTA